jgi:hypothetical protein
VCARWYTNPRSFLGVGWRTRLGVAFEVALLAAPLSVRQREAITRLTLRSFHQRRALWYSGVLLPSPFSVTSSVR